MVARWAQALARQLPAGMVVSAVSPGSAPDTAALRRGGFLMKWLMLPMMRVLPGMAQTVDVAAQRYLQAATFGPEVSGEFHASAPGKVSGPLQVMKHPHFHDRASQDAAWKAVVNVSGVPFPARASHLQVSRLAAECPPLPPAAVG